ncbi:S-adenosyl-L-methionine-dependent methyltransferase [Nemania sp. FL0031]|nr:S-adenosyl-L-methionine-dependent methyltransferase [Nemania sp. FL0031]
MANTSTDYSANAFTNGANSEGALDNGNAFWRAYISNRPAPPESFLQLIYNYHQENGDPRTAVAHDVGTGPGNIAQRLLPYFDYVVGSDVADDALNMARVLIPPDDLKRMMFVHSPAEELVKAPLPKHAGPGETDLLLVSECMPLLDAPRAVQAFHTMLRPGGTLAIYFYGRPIFVGSNSETYNAIYRQIADTAVQCLHPFKGTPIFPAYYSSGTTLLSWLDNIELPTESWENVERRKWNHDHLLAFCSEEGYDFEIKLVDRTHPGETKKQTIDREFWAREMSVDGLAAYLVSVLPGYRSRPETADRVAKVDEMLQQLQVAMGGKDSKAKVTFPVVLILATKKSI